MFSQQTQQLDASTPKSSNALTSIESRLKIAGIYFQKDVPLKYETYFKRGGLAKIFICPDSKEKLKIALDILKNAQQLYKVVGQTSNVFFIDEIDYSVIVSTKNLRSIEVNKETIYADAGYPIQDFVRLAIISGSTGFEGLEGIPASIGGALFMNAGAYGYSVSDNLVSVDCVDEEGNFISLSKQECKFGYRESIFRESSLVILGARFKLTPGNRDEIRKKVETFHIARHSYQDFVYPNLGSMISVTGDIYGRILKKSSIYGIKFWILKLALRNPISKFIRRKRPNNEPFNHLLNHYFSGTASEIPRYRLSNKNANILINDGQCETQDLLSYICRISSAVGKQYHIENEVVTHPIYSADEEFLDKYRNLINSVSEAHK